MVVANFTEKRQTVVVGAGPGGYVAAIRAAQEGQEVTIIEREYMGGVCLNVGCIPSKALISASTRYQEAQSENAEVFGVTTENVQIDWAKTQEWKQTGVVDRMTNGVESLLKKNNVEIVKGNAYFNGKNTVHVDGDNPITYEFENAIIATGSSPIEIPGFKYGGRVLDSTGALNLEEIPESIVFIGGGVIGSELGGVYSRLGSKVTILEGAKNILGTYERDMIRLVTQQFEKEGTEIVTSALAKEAVDNGDSVTVKYEVDGEEKEVTADYVVVTVGRSPNTDDIGLEGLGVEVDERGYVKVDEQGRTTNEKVFAIGDIVPGAALAHKASYEAKVAAEAISGGAGVVDYKAMPAVSFTHPELATTGMTKADAKEAGIKVNTTKFLYGGNGRAVSMDAAEGFVRLITTKDDNIIVGADVAGAGASDLIAELTLAIEAGMNAEDIALTVHAHPTLAEMIMDAAEAALGQPIHS